MSKIGLKNKELDKVIRILPLKERNRIKNADLTKEFIEEEINLAKKAMKLDTYIGLPWFILYVYMLWSTGFSNFTVALFFIGLIYFVHAFFTRGSYGLNSKRLKVFEELKKKF